jgi:chromosomal replication initiator protein
MAELWQRCLERLESALDPTDVVTWLLPIQARIDDRILVLLAPNSFIVDRVRAAFLPQIAELARHLDPTLLDVRLEVGSVARVARVDGAGPAGGGVPAAAAAVDVVESSLEPAYTFETFVVGRSNELGRSAAIEVAMNPGRSYNPLLLYGGTGLGKTHLMHAAGNLIRQNNPRARVLYQRSEQFFSAMSRALSNRVPGNRAIDEFRERYRAVDALLLDDIQFFAGKERTQEEFFHAFNDLIQGKQQIIVTCDRYPKEVENLEQRLQSRLGWGLSVAIEPPDFETRAAILKAKADAKGFALGDEVAFLIARRMRSNVRDLEGALNTLIARATFQRRDPTPEFAQEALRDLLTVQERAVSLPNIQAKVADYYQIRVQELNSKKRNRSLVRPRQMAMALAKELTSHSLPEIGDAFGGRDHTTVIHACRTIHDLKAKDGRMAEDWDRLLRLLSG